jgi:hypothetical protein
MNATSATCGQLTLPGIPNAISLLASASGLTRSVSPAGLIRAGSGLVRALANLSARQAKEMGLLTSGTSGRTGITSSASAALALSLESRLRARTALHGSTLYKLTWKVRTMPSGRKISALRGSVRRNSDSGFTSWPAPVVNDSTGSDYAYNRGRHDSITLKLGGAAKLSSWPAPTAALADKGVRSTEGGIREAMRSHGPDLAAMACLASWPAPMAGTPAQNGNNEAGNNDSSRKTVELASWIAPQAADANGSGINQHTSSLCQQARRTVSGLMLIGSAAQMGSGGQLNPAHSRWLMGLPPVWDACGVTAMQSLPSKRRRLSKQRVSVTEGPSL